jgi:hypothetical protein
MCLTDGVLQAYFDQELSAADRTEVAARLAACDACRQRATIVEQRRNRVAALFSATTPAEGQIPAVAALTRFHARVAEAERAPVLGLGFVLKAALAAGVVGLVVFVVATAWRPAPGAQGPARADRQAPAPTPLAAPPEPLVARAAPGEDTATPRVERVAARRPSRAPRRALPSAPVDPYLLLTEDASRPEMGMVVRVRLPLSVLTTFGDMPSNSRTSPEIEADVLVGQDGRARAIRFVSQTLTPGRK